MIFPARGGVVIGETAALGNPGRTLNPNRTPT